MPKTWWNKIQGAPGSSGAWFSSTMLAAHGTTGFFSMQQTQPEYRKHLNRWNSAYIRGWAGHSLTKIHHLVFERALLKKKWPSYAFCVTFAEQWTESTSVLLWKDDIILSKWLRIHPEQSESNWDSGDRKSCLYYIRKQVISYIKRWPCNGALVRGWEWRWPSLGCCECSGHVARACGRSLISSLQHLSQIQDLICSYLFVAHTCCAALSFTRMWMRSWIVCMCHLRLRTSEKDRKQVGKSHEKPVPKGINRGKSTPDARWYPAWSLLVRMRVVVGPCKEWKGEGPSTGKPVVEDFPKNALSRSDMSHIFRLQGPFLHFCFLRTYAQNLGLVCT